MRKTILNHVELNSYETCLSFGVNGACRLSPFGSDGSNSMASSEKVWAHRAI